jgi:predicted HicB family RNase H-like nuclease
MTVVTYRDYQAEVAFSDGRILIVVLHVKDFLSAECDSAREVEAVFHQLVDDYLEDCKATGREPAKPYSGKFNVRIDPALHKKAAMIAAESEDSLNAFVEQAVRYAVDAHEHAGAVNHWSMEAARSLAKEFERGGEPYLSLSSHIEKQHTHSSHFRMSKDQISEVEIASLKALASLGPSKRRKEMAN